MIHGVVQTSQIGKSNSKSAIRNQESLKLAMEEARRLVLTSPLPPISPIKLPKSPSAMILRVLKDGEMDDLSRPQTPNTTFGSDFETEIQVH